MTTVLLAMAWTLAMTFCLLLLALIVVSLPGRRAELDAALRRAFPRRVLRQLEAELAHAAADEAARIERELHSYLRGPHIGSVVGATELSTGMSLALSDGKMIMMGGVAHCTRRRLVDSTAVMAMQPASAARSGPTYRLVLCAHDGPDFELYAQRIALVGA